MFKSEISSIDINNELITEINFQNRSLVSGIWLTIIRIGIRLRMLSLIIRNYPAPNDWVKALKYLIALRKNILGTPKIKKLAKINGKYYMGIYTSSWFSKEFDQFILSHLNDFKPIKMPSNRFDMVFISVTNKCPYRCEHCYHWNLLNKKDQQSLEELSNIINTLQQKGVSHIQFTGGEPLLEYKKICEAVKLSKETSEFWITTSGFSLTKEKAKVLKASGIRGTIISLDHFDPEKHNRFRNHKDAFNWVEFAIKNATNAGLIVALSACITKDLLTVSNLENYMKLAKDLGVSFVQFLEPKPIGQYKNKDVLLTKTLIDELERFFLRYNFSTSYLDYPIIIYPGFHQRREGCMFAGKKSIYIDTSGYINPCPFCHRSYGKVLENGFSYKLEQMLNQGCEEYGFARL